MKTLYYTGSLVLIVAAVAVLFAYLVPQNLSAQALTLGRLGARCNMSATTTVVIGNQSSTQILAAHSLRAWATIQLPSLGGVSTNTVSLNFDAPATLASGYELSTSTREFSLGLNESFPFVGAVNAITSTGSTTIRVIECRY